MKIKEIALYLGLILVGTTISFAVLHKDRLQEFLRPAYVEGNYQEYFLANAVKPESEVLLYGASWCKYCEKARLYFQVNQIHYVELDIEKNPEAKEQYQKLKGEIIPVILIGNRRIDGYKPDQYKEAMQRTRVSP